MNKVPTIIFGGSFDPVHVGHLALATEACNRDLASEVWFMLSPLNPHKVGRKITAEDKRLHMLQLAVEGDARFKASDFELSLPRPSYTVNTLMALEEAFPEREFLLLIGADNWEKFDKWYKWETILSRYKIIVYPRGEMEKPSLPEGVEWLAAELHDVSSTMVRSAVAEGGDITGMVPPAVAQFIRENNLYSE